MRSLGNLNRTLVAVAYPPAYRSGALLRRCHELPGVAIIAKDDGLCLDFGVASSHHGIRHALMVGREVAYRIGIGWIAGEQVRLAPASSEILHLFRTRSTRFLHPRIAAIAVEALGVVPDRLEARLPALSGYQTGRGRDGHFHARHRRLRRAHTYPC